MSILEKIVLKRKENTSLKKLNDINLSVALTLYEKKDYEKAFPLFSVIAENGNNPEAQYYTATCYALGQGCKYDMVQALYWFHKSYIGGMNEALKYEKKAYLDCIKSILKSESSFDTIFNAHLKLIRLIKPEQDEIQFANNEALEASLHLINELNAYDSAAKLLRAHAEYGNSAMCQNYLGVLYNSGCGVEKNDLIALYWFNRAACRNIKEAEHDKVGILNAYRQNLSKENFTKAIVNLINRCIYGDIDIPKDLDSACYWIEEFREILPYGKIEEWRNITANG